MRSISSTARRQFVLKALAGTLALSWLPAFAARKRKKKAPAAPVCRLTAEQEEGPFYIEGEALRSNLVEDREGVPLTLRLQLLDMPHCTPLKDASVEIWSCDANGEYSGYSSEQMSAQVDPPPDGMGPPPGIPSGQPPHHRPDNQKTFLRGRQHTEENGRVEFATIYPGCYAGRVNHIHVKVRLNEGGRIVHTGQLFFPEAVTDAVLALPPYSAHQIRRTRASEDMVYTSQHGENSVLEIEAAQPGVIAKGFVGT
ncbi:MAG TPA: intradiol ring-cleavage dioxygenase, partial [Burkholderiaceae bacterium]